VNALEGSSDVTLRRAQQVSGILHPWAVLAPALALAAYRATGNPLECIKWTLIAFLPATVFPLVYAKIRATVLSRRGTRRKISRSLVRNDPGQLFIMTGLFGIPSALILHYLGAPRNLLIIILGVTAVMLVVAIVNLKYRTSFHLSMVTCILTSLYIIFGPALLFTFVVIPILGLSRYQLSEHTPMQIISGFFIGLVIGGAVFYGLGLGA